MRLITCAASIVLFAVTSASTAVAEPTVLRVGGAVESLSWGPDGGTLAVHVRPAARGDGEKAPRLGGRSIQLWDVAGRRLVRGIPVPARTSVAGRFTPDGRSVACGVWREPDRLQELVAGKRDRRKTEVWLWDAATGERTGTLAAAPLRGLSLPFTSDVVSLAISPDGTVVAAGTKLVSDGDVTGHHIGGEVCLWDLGNGRLKWNARAVHTDIVYAVAFSPDGRTLASGGRDKLVRLWDAETGGVTRTLFGAGWDGIASLAFSPDGSVLASGGDSSAAAEEGGRVRVWEVESGRLVRTFGEFHAGSPVRVTYAPDATLYAVGQALGDGPPKWQALAWHRPVAGARRLVAERPGFARAVSVSPDGKALAVGTSDGDVVIVEAVD